jgi:hypothetical protein
MTKALLYLQTIEVGDAVLRQQYTERQLAEIARTRRATAVVLIKKTCLIKQQVPEDDLWIVSNALFDPSKLTLNVFQKTMRRLLSLTTRQEIWMRTSEIIQEGLRGCVVLLIISQGSHDKWKGLTMMCRREAVIVQEDKEYDKRLSVLVKQ